MPTSCNCSQLAVDIQIKYEIFTKADLVTVALLFSVYL